MKLPVERTTIPAIISNYKPKFTQLHPFKLIKPISRVHHHEETPSTHRNLKTGNTKTLIRQTTSPPATNHAQYHIKTLTPIFSPQGFLPRLAARAATSRHISPTSSITLRSSYHHPPHSVCQNCPRGNYPHKSKCIHLPFPALLNRPSWSKLLPRLEPSTLTKKRAPDKLAPTGVCLLHPCQRKVWKRHMDTTGEVAMKPIKGVKLER